MSSESSRWSLRYAFGLTPWELGAPHPELVRRLGSPDGFGTGPGRVLVPGCGRGHDALAFAQAGWEVVAVDFAPQAVARARELLGPDVDVVEADVFRWTPDRPFDVLFDHTFLCSLEPALRPGFGALARRTVGERGVVAGIVYPIGKCPPDDGPPYALDVTDVSVALGEDFVLEEVSDPIDDDPRRWPARFARWRRRAVSRRP